MEHLKMNEFKYNFISNNSSFADCITKISKAKIKTLFVLNKSKKLVGTISDGDIRRGVLKYQNLESTASKIMRRNFFYLTKKKLIDYKTLKKNNFLLIPILNNKKEIIDIKKLEEDVNKTSFNNTVLIMAGGFGKRLRPYTDKIPKPMLKIYGVPILERIICNFRDYGFKNFIISTFYKSKKISNYFKNGKKLKINITYINEKKPLGTAGALSLIPKKIKDSIIVANGDVLTKLNPVTLINYHEDNKFDFTVTSINYNYQLPFGSIDIKKNKIFSLEEKPKIVYKINAGIYVVSSKIYKKIKKNVNISMTDLIKTLIIKKKKVGAFPIYENWDDIGDKKTFNKLNNQNLIDL